MVFKHAIYEIDEFFVVDSSETNPNSDDIQQATDNETLNDKTLLSDKLLVLQLKLSVNYKLFQNSELKKDLLNLLDTGFGSLFRNFDQETLAQSKFEDRKKELLAKDPRSKIHSKSICILTERSSSPEMKINSMSEDLPIDNCFAVDYYPASIDQDFCGPHDITNDNYLQHLAHSNPSHARNQKKSDTFSTTTTTTERAKTTQPADSNYLEANLKKSEQILKKYFKSDGSDTIINFNLNYFDYNNKIILKPNYTESTMASKSSSIFCIYNQLKQGPEAFEFSQKNQGKLLYDQETVFFLGMMYDDQFFDIRDYTQSLMNILT